MTTTATDWTRQPARPVAAIVIATLVACALPSAFSRSPIPPTTSSRPAFDTRLDLNAATFEELVMLPGIGEARARAILDHRKAHGPFESIESLDAVRGFGPRTIEDLLPFLMVSPQAPPAP